MDLFTAIKANKPAFTANGALTHASSGNACLDLFFVIGSARRADIREEFVAAFDENPELAVRILLWARDARGGAGERETFRKLVRVLESEERYHDIVKAILRKIPEIGRFDDLFCVTSDELFQYSAFILLDAVKSGNKLAGKWLPREKSANREIAQRLCKVWGMTPRSYRKLCSALSSTVEQKMCAKEWEAIVYEHVPSVAMARYKTAFSRNDKERFSDFIGKVNKGETTINAGVVFPHDILRGAYESRHYGRFNWDAAQAQWKNLPDFVDGNADSVLCVCDVSGSMDTKVSGSVTALDVCVGLGMYIAERSEGIFKNKVVTFDSDPTFVNLFGNLQQRFTTLIDAPWGGSTNLQKTFDIVLKAAKNGNLPQDKMPKTILILSDMEFDSCTYWNEPTTNFFEIKRKYAGSGYEMPQLVFWNLNGRGGNLPVRLNADSVALVSGYSPSILKSVLKGDLNPMQIMLDTVMVDRYKLS